ncbi:MAG TPA: HEAT repeat domain-containing protein, partial [Acidimicrobiales bacterium]
AESDADVALAEARLRRQVTLAGHTGDEDAARTRLRDASPGLRAASLGALARMHRLAPSELASALADPAPEVRRRACELSIGLPAVDLRPLLGDPEPLVVEAAAWAVGERREAAVVDAVARVATEHADPLCREAAVAALGAIGDDRGLPAILAAQNDRPAVRRRAVIALAPFQGSAVEAGLERARQDRDWQVRQAAEDLLDEPGGS